ncbi:MAG: glycosyl transferase family protein [Gammaproteobacteria bacterium]|jgi:hypothetical protein|nr:glycosyl transferase family protein [Gammaproteobacteria bacterium]
MSNTNTVPTSAKKYLIYLVLACFFLGVLRYIELPGLYFDAVNPDYIAAMILNHHIHNMAWVLPSIIKIPLLVELYHGVQHIYLGLPFFFIFGTSIVTLRLFQAAFGAGAIYFGYRVTTLLTKNRWFAFVAMLGLATEIAFIASFRTQFYITMAGDFWLFAAIFVLLKANEENSLDKKHLLFIGCFYGLAVYSYFIYLFFLPAIALWVFLNSPRGKRILSGYYWVQGVAIGLIPYALGYLSMLLALRKQFLTAIFNTAHVLQPLSHRLGLIESWQHGFHLLISALTNSGNESLMFKHTGITFLENGKIYCLITLLIFGLLLGLIAKKTSEDKNCWFFILLPISFFTFATLFGARLGVHHYSVLIPFFYIELAIAAFFIWRLAAATSLANLTNKILIIVASLLILLNITQQQCFFNYLDATGGIYRYSNALNLMAEEAIGVKDKALYIFPEWGFMTSFDFLTGNRVAYDLNLDKQAEDALKQGKELRLCFWNIEDFNQYKKALHNIGAVNLQVVPYLQRDGNIAFYMIRASRPPISHNG